VFRVVSVIRGSSFLFYCGPWFSEAKGITTNHTNHTKHHEKNFMRKGHTETYIDIPFPNELFCCNETMPETFK